MSSAPSLPIAFTALPEIVCVCGVCVCVCVCVSACNAVGKWEGGMREA